MRNSDRSPEFNREQRVDGRLERRWRRMMEQQNQFHAEIVALVDSGDGAIPRSFGIGK
ncbi:MAG: hypothetical protein AB8F26_02610 [Phycisphaerales bacterium]